MFKIGNVFQSERALVRCHSEPTATPDGHGGYVIGTNPLSLIPNNYNPKTDRITGRFPVHVGDVNLGTVDCGNINEGRQNSLWCLTQVAINGAGCGNGHHISGSEFSWARYDCVAVRINADGTKHQSGETITFSSAGNRSIQDLKFVRLAQSA